MTDKRHPEEERQALAAEYALGLLTGDEASGARELAATDADFAGEVARWRGRLAPLAGDVKSVDPPGNVWSRIASAIDGTADGSNVIQLRRRVNVWRGATAGMTALAAALAGVLVGRGDRLRRGFAAYAATALWSRLDRAVRGWWAHQREIVLTREVCAHGTAHCTDRLQRQVLHVLSRCRVD